MIDFWSSDYYAIIRRLLLSSANYSYLSDGTKISATNASGDGLVYIGSLVYRKRNGVLSLESVGFNGGRFVATNTGVEPRYFLTDHLGSTRVVVNSAGKVLERNDYHAYGKRWADANSLLSDNRYGYNGKEKQDFVSLPYLDYGSRMADLLLGRWFNLDPLSEKYYSTSPFVFCAGNPISFVDLNGMDWYSYMVNDYNAIGEFIGKHVEYAYTELTSQEALNKAGIEGQYLGEVVVIFEGSIDERIGNDGTLTGDNANPAQVTIYGKNGKDDIEQYNGLTVSSDPNIYPMIEQGSYKAYHEQMPTSVYGKDAYTYRVTTMNGNLLIPPVGGINKRTGATYISGEYLHRTDWNGKATKSSQACLVIDGRSWKMVEKQIGKSHNIYIKVNR